MATKPLLFGAALLFYENLENIIFNKDNIQKKNFPIVVFLY